MGTNTRISWTDHTFNIAWGCTKVSPGCSNCYAEVSSERGGFDVWGPTKDRRLFGQKHWNEPLKWDRLANKEGKKHLVFSSSMCDNFEDHPMIIGELNKFWKLTKATPHLEWQVLTKRADRIAQSLPADWGNGYPNVWLGVTVENNDYVSRTDYLRKIPCKVRFVSYEPALGPADNINLEGIDWVIYGGESGPDFRPDDSEWARTMRKLCRESGVAFFYKQTSAIQSGTNPYLDGEEIKEFPKY